MTGRPGKSQREGQEDQGAIHEGALLAALRSPGPSGLPSDSSLGSLRIHRRLNKDLEGLNPSFSFAGYISMNNISPGGSSNKGLQSPLKWFL